MDFEKLFSRFRELRVGVIGDVMLDTYWWGKVDRISPEAPVPVVAVSGKEQRLGGAGNVALNIAALGSKVDLLSVVGEDGDGFLLKGMLEEKKIGTEFLLTSSERVTTNKIRIISRNQHMMRLDAEITAPLDNRDEERLIISFKNYISTQRPDIIILEDYNKGVLSLNVIHEVMKICKEHSILTAVDPKRKNFFEFTGATIFKPNLHEAKEGLNLLSDEVNPEFLHDIHLSLQARLSHEISFITLSERGVFYHDSDKSAIIPTHIRTIADVSGAGDTVIAVASIVYAATRDVKLMAEMANIAGGLVCEEVGTVAINLEQLKHECKALLK